MEIDVVSFGLGVIAAACICAVMSLVFALIDWLEK